MFKMTQEIESKKRNINVEVEEELYFKLREEASKNQLEFHDWIRLIYQKEVE